jgi:hypothetical protein
MSKQFVTTGYLAVRFQTTPAKILKALQSLGREPAMILNDLCYWDGDDGNLAGLALTLPGAESLGRSPMATEADADG